MSTEPRTSAAVPVPPTVKFSLVGTTLTAKGPLGTVTRPFPSDALGLATAGETVTLTLRLPANRKRARALLNTWERHLANLVGGVTAGVEAKMKIVAAHFPMKVQAKDDQVVVENFLGEKYPRTAWLDTGVSARVDGEYVILSGIDVERVGQSAANIEQTTHIRDYDPRVFQDGIYIIEKAHLKEAS